MSIERLRGSNSDEYNEEDEEIELEIVEVEELEEPVPTQDSCLQVKYANIFIFFFFNDSNHFISLFSCVTFYFR